MKLRIVLIMVTLTILLLGCNDPFGTTERAQIRLDEKREENRALAWQAEIAKAGVDETKATWEGRAFFLGVLSTTTMPYFFSFLAFLLAVAVAYPIFMRVSGLYVPPKRESDAD